MMALRPLGALEPRGRRRRGGILADVRARGDAAVVEATARFDWPRRRPLPRLAVPADEIEAAYGRWTRAVSQRWRLSVDNCIFFHRHELAPGLGGKGAQGQKLGIRHLPVERAGLYVPGGLGSYASTVVMNAVPALVAGVGELIICTPPGRDG